MVSNRRGSSFRAKRKDTADENPCDGTKFTAKTGYRTARAYTDHGIYHCDGGCDGDCCTDGLGTRWCGCDDSCDSDCECNAGYYGPINTDSPNCKQCNGRDTYQSKPEWNGCNDARTGCNGGRYWDGATIYTSGVCTAVPDGMYVGYNNRNQMDYDVKRWSDCDANEYQSSAPTAYSDRGCSPCPYCTSRTTYYSGSCNANVGQLSFCIACEAGKTEPIATGNDKHRRLTCTHKCGDDHSGDYQPLTGQSVCQNVCQWQTSWAWPRDYTEHCGEAAKTTDCFGGFHGEHCLNVPNAHNPTIASSGDGTIFTLSDNGCNTGCWDGFTSVSRNLGEERHSDDDHSTVSFHPSDQTIKHTAYTNPSGESCEINDKACVLQSPHVFVKNIETVDSLALQLKFDTHYYKVADGMPPLPVFPHLKNKADEDTSEIAEWKLGIVKTHTSVSNLANGETQSQQTYLGNEVTEPPNFKKKDFVSSIPTSKTVEFNYGIPSGSAGKDQCKSHVVEINVQNGGQVVLGDMGKDYKSNLETPSDKYWGYNGNTRTAKIEIIVDGDKPIAPSANNNELALRTMVFASDEKKYVEASHFSKETSFKVAVAGWQDQCSHGKVIHKYVLKVCRLLVEGAVGSMELNEDHDEEKCILKTKTLYASKVAKFGSGHGSSGYVQSDLYTALGTDCPGSCPEDTDCTSPSVAVCPVNTVVKSLEEDGPSTNKFEVDVHLGKVASTVGAYYVSLAVFDEAGNYARARRFIYNHKDPDSTLKVTPGSKVLIETAGCPLLANNHAAGDDAQVFDVQGGGTTYGSHEYSNGCKCSHNTAQICGKGKSLAEHLLRDNQDEVWQWNASQLVVSWYGVFSDHATEPYLLPIAAEKSSGPNTGCTTPPRKETKEIFKIESISAGTFTTDDKCVVAIGFLKADKTECEAITTQETCTSKKSAANTAVYACIWQLKGSADAAVFTIKEDHNLETGDAVYITKVASAGTCADKINGRHVLTEIVDDTDDKCVEATGFEADADACAAITKKDTCTSKKSAADAQSIACFWQSKTKFRVEKYEATQDPRVLLRVQLFCADSATGGSVQSVATATPDFSQPTYDYDDKHRTPVAVLNNGKAEELTLDVKNGKELMKSGVPNIDGIVSYSWGYRELVETALFVHVGEVEIKAISNDDPAVITSNDHGLKNGDEIIITGVAGAGVDDFNGRHTVQSVASTTFTIEGISGKGISVNPNAFGRFTAPFKDLVKPDIEMIPLDNVEQGTCKNKISTRVPISSNVVEVGCYSYSSAILSNIKGYIAESEVPGLTYEQCNEKAFLKITNCQTPEPAYYFGLFNPLPAFSTDPKTEEINRKKRTGTCVLFNQIPKCWTNSDNSLVKLVAEASSSNCTLSDVEGRYMGAANKIMVYKTNAPPLTNPDWIKLPPWHHTKKLEKDGKGTDGMLKNGATYKVSIQATSQFGAKKIVSSKFSVDTTPPNLWDFRMVCLQRTEAGTSATGQVLCGHSATSRPDHLTADTFTRSTSDETTLMVHSVRDFRNLRLHFSAFDAESAVNNYHWELYENKNGFLRETSKNGEIDSCEDHHVGNCEQEFVETSLILAESGGTEVITPLVEPPTSSTPINEGMYLPDDKVPVYECAANSAHVCENNVCVTDGNGKLNPKLTFTTESKAAGCSAANTAVCRVACVCTRSYQIQKSLGRICRPLETTFYSLKTEHSKVLQPLQHNRNYTFSLTVINGAGLKTVQQRKIQVDTTPPTSGAVIDGNTDNDEDWQVDGDLHASWSGFHDPDSGIRGYLYKWTSYSNASEAVTCAAPPSTTNEVTDHAWSFTDQISAIKPAADVEAKLGQKWVITVIAYNNALSMSKAVCSDGIFVDNQPPPEVLATSVTIPGSRGPAGLIIGKGDADDTETGTLWLVLPDLQRRKVVEPADDLGKKAYEECKKRAYNLETNVPESPWKDLSSYADVGGQYAFNAAEWDLEQTFTGTTIAKDKTIGSPALRQSYDVEAVGGNGKLVKGQLVTGSITNAAGEAAADIYVEHVISETAFVLSEAVTIGNGVKLNFRLTVETDELAHAPKVGENIANTCPFPKLDHSLLQFTLHQNALKFSWVPKWNAEERWTADTLADWSVGKSSGNNPAGASFVETHGREDFLLHSLTGKFYVHLKATKRNGESQTQTYGPFVHIQKGPSTAESTTKPADADSSGEMKTTVNYAKRLIIVDWSGADMKTHADDKITFNPHVAQVEYSVGLMVASTKKMLLPFTPVHPYDVSAGCKATASTCWSVKFAAAEDPVPAADAPDCRDVANAVAGSAGCPHPTLQAVPSFVAVVRACSLHYAGVCTLYKSADTTPGIPRAPPSKGTVYEQAGGRLQDADYQVSKTAISAKWTGFAVAVDVGTVTYSANIKIGEIYSYMHSPQTITGINSDTPAAVFTATGHGLSNGDFIFIADVTGTGDAAAAFHGRHTVAEVTDNTFQIVGLSGKDVDFSSFGSFVLQTAGTSYTFTGLALKEGETYCVEVWATNEVGSTSAMSDCIKIISDDAHKELTVHNGPGLNTEAAAFSLGEDSIVLEAVPVADPSPLQTISSQLSLPGLRGGTVYTAFVNVRGISAPVGVQKVHLRIGIKEIELPWEDLRSKGYDKPITFYAASNEEKFTILFDSLPEEGSVASALTARVAKMDVHEGMLDALYAPVNHSPAASWTVKNIKPSNVGVYHYEWRVLKKDPSAQSTDKFTKVAFDWINVGQHTSAYNPDHALAAGTYKTEVRVCTPLGCTANPTVADKEYVVYAEDAAPVPDQITPMSAGYSQPAKHDGSTLFSLSWPPFIYPELNNEIVMYMWRVQLYAPHGNALLVDWQYVSVADANSKIAVERTFSEIDLSLHESDQVYLTVHAYGPNGRVGRASTRVEALSTISSTLALVVLDMRPSDFEGGALLPHVPKADIQYSSSTTHLAAAWPSIWEDEDPEYILWAISVDRAFDPTCTRAEADAQKAAVAQGTAAVQTCGSVRGDVEASTILQRLTEGTRYYFCLKAGPRKWIDLKTGQEKSVSNDDVPTVCSNGVVVDARPPGQGIILVHQPAYGVGAQDLPAYQHSRSIVLVSWHGFEDAEANSNAPHASGIASYSVVLGTSPGASNIWPTTSSDATPSNTNSSGNQDEPQWRDLSTSMEVRGLNIGDGTPVYAAVTACDHVGLCTTSVSHPVVVDGSPPTKGHVSVKQVNRNDASGSDADDLVVQVCWTPFTDDDSGIASYELGFGSEPNYGDLDNGDFQVAKVANLCQERILKNIARKQHFYATVIGKNHAGLATFSSSVIALAPSDDVVPHGHVWDGVAVSNEDYAVDVDFQADRTTLSAHWSWTAGFEEDVVEYRWAIGTNNQHQQSTPDVLGWESVGRLKSATQAGLSLHDGHTYYVMVQACDMFGSCGTAVSDGVMIDGTPPGAGSVFDGIAEVDAQFQHDTSTISASWTGFADPESDVAEYQWCWKTSIDPNRCGSDSEHFVSVGMMTTGYFAGVDEGVLAHDVVVTIVVRAYNRAGGAPITVASNGVTINHELPAIDESHRPVWKPVFGLQAYDADDDGVAPDHPTQTAGTVLSASWKFKPNKQSLMYHYSITTHDGADGSTVFRQSFAETVQKAKDGAGQPVDGFKIHSLPLQDGERYYLAVTACDETGLCSNKASPTKDGILVDSSPPMTGNMLNGMTYTESGNRLHLAWHGFEDPHSGIKDYWIMVGSKYGDNDLYDKRYTVAERVITAISTADPAVITASEQHGLVNGNTIYISGVVGTAAGTMNGRRTVTRVDDNTFTISGVSKDGTLIPVAGSASTTVAADGTTIFRKLNDQGNQHAGYMHGDVTGEGKTGASNACKNAPDPYTSNNGNLDNEHDCLYGTGALQARGWDEPWAKYIAHTTSSSVLHTVTLEKAIPTNRFYVTITARNKVGLESEPVHTTVEVSTHQFAGSKSLDIVHHSCDNLESEFRCHTANDDERAVGLTREVACSCGAVANKCKAHEVNDHPTNDDYTCPADDDDDASDSSDIPDCTVYDGLRNADGTDVDIDFQSETKVYAAHWTCNVTGDLAKNITRIQYAVTSRSAEARKKTNAYSEYGNRYKFGGNSTESDILNGHTSKLVHKLSTHGHEMRFWSEVGFDVESANGMAVFTTECHADVCKHPDGDFSVGSSKMGGVNNKESKNGYEFHLRVWGKQGGFRDFVSDGIDITPTRPKISRKRSALRETAATNPQGQAHDEHDRLGEAGTGSTVTLNIDWKNLFKYSNDGGKGKVKTPFADIKVGVGSTPMSPNIVGLKSVSTLDTAKKGCGERPEAGIDWPWCTATSVKVEVPLRTAGARYYSFARAENAAGLASWSVSDGFVVDHTGPVGGAVHDGAMHGVDVDYQSSEEGKPLTLHATWGGFYDPESHIDTFSWAVSTNHASAEAFDDNIVAGSGWHHDAFMPAASYTIDAGVKTSTTFYFGVKATNTAGLTSDLVISDGVTVDVTAPVLYEACTSASEGGGTAVTCADALDYKDVSNVDAADPRYAEPRRLPSKEASVTCTLKSLVKGTRYSFSFFAGVASEHVGASQYGSVSIRPGTTAADGAAPGAPVHHETFHVEKVHPSTNGWSEVRFMFEASSSGDFTLAVAGSTMKAGGGEVLVDLGSVRTKACAASASTVNTISIGVVRDTVEAQWDAADVESGIASMQWALGTINGGTQYQPYKEVHVLHPNLESSAVVVRATLPGGLGEKQPLVASVILTNRAGLTSTFYSEPLVVDRTPPSGSIRFVKGGLASDALELAIAYGNKKEVYLDASKIVDYESSIVSCRWAVGSAPGIYDVSGKWSAVELDGPGNTGLPTALITCDLSSSGAAVEHLDYVYATVRCENAAGLVSEVSTQAGARLLLRKLVPDAASAVIEVIQPFRTAHHAVAADPRLPAVDNLLLLPKAGSFYSQTTTGDQRVRWHGFQFASETVKRYHVQVERAGSRPAAAWNPKVDTQMTAGTQSELLLTGMQLLADADYNVRVRAEDLAGKKSDAIVAKLHIDATAPKYVPSTEVCAHMDSDRLTLSWKNVFEESCSAEDANDGCMIYKVSISSRLVASAQKGSGDLLRWHVTRAEFIRIQANMMPEWWMKLAREKKETIFVTIVAQNFAGHKTVVTPAQIEKLGEGNNFGVAVKYGTSGTCI